MAQWEAFMYQKGFTLIELLVVVLIIGILSAVALPQYTKAVEKSRAAEMMTFMSSAKKAVSLWVLQNGPIPTANTELLQSGSLDIDLTSGLTCDDGRACKTKNFNYEILCERGECWIHFARNNEGSDDYYKGYLETNDGSSWTGFCGYESALGKTVCDMFVALGTDVVVEGV